MKSGHCIGCTHKELPQSCLIKERISSLQLQLGSTKFFHAFSICSQLLTQNTQLHFGTHHKEVKLKEGFRLPICSSET